MFSRICTMYYYKRVKIKKALKSLYILKWCNLPIKPTGFYKYIPVRITTTRITNMANTVRTGITAFGFAFVVFPSYNAFINCNKCYILFRTLFCCCTHIVTPNENTIACKNRWYFDVVENYPLFCSYFTTETTFVFNRSM